MSKKNVVTLVAAALCVAGAMAGSAVAQKQSVPKPWESASVEQGQVQQLAVPIVLPVDQSGHVSKKDWLAAASEKFDKLDANNKGYVDATQLTQAEIVTPSAKFGK